MTNTIKKLKIGHAQLSTEVVTNVDVAADIAVGEHGVVTSETIYNALSRLSADIESAIQDLT